jgi:hypothetical protein
MLIRFMYLVDELIRASRRSRAPSTKRRWKYTGPAASRLHQRGRVSGSSVRARRSARIHRAKLKGSSSKRVPSSSGVCTRPADTDEIKFFETAAPASGKPLSGATSSRSRPWCKNGTPQDRTDVRDAGGVMPVIEAAGAEELVADTVNTMTMIRKLATAAPESLPIVASLGVARIQVVAELRRDLVPGGDLQVERRACSRKAIWAW